MKEGNTIHPGENKQPISGIISRTGPVHTGPVRTGPVYCVRIIFHFLFTRDRFSTATIRENVFRTLPAFPVPYQGFTPQTVNSATSFSFFSSKFMGNLLLVFDRKNQQTMAAF
jgi:hypothetical protein